MESNGWPIFTIDAFTNDPFKGNPAAVCVLPDGEAYPADDWLLAMAQEMNLSETVYLRRRDEGDGYEIRQDCVVVPQSFVLGKHLELTLETRRKPIHGGFSPASLPSRVPKTNPQPNKLQRFNQQKT